MQTLSYEVKVADGSKISGTVKSISTVKELKSLTGKRARQATDALIRADVVRAQNTDRTAWAKSHPVAIAISLIAKSDKNAAKVAAETLAGSLKSEHAAYLKAISEESDDE